MPYANQCGKCGAVRADAQIGLEETPVLYVAEMVAVFREVRRVLRDDGVLWLNLGDSYCSTTGATTLRPGNPDKNGGNSNRDGVCAPGAKPKDLLMMPARVALALQADGWYLRSDVIWHKPNPMPESVTDRPTSAHEHVFLLTKSPRYFYDADAVREAYAPASAERYGYDFRADIPSAIANKSPSLGAGRIEQNPAGRNLRNVWTIATAPFSEAHFATFPPELAERCIKAGSRPGDTVLDPFGGAGTTGLLADRLGRSAVLIELNPEYQAMAKARVVADGPLFADVAS